MTEHDKIPLAGEMLVQAVKSYEHALKDIDYVTSILLAGAVIGIIAPLLEELDIKSSQVALAELSVKSSNSTSLDKKVGRAIGFYRFTYNALKHAGHGKNIPASKDLVIHADLKDEAEFLIRHAVQDYNKIPEPYITLEYINNNMPHELLDVLQSW
ncbi:hypothetical protein [uncultured Psychrosphaera sp.]|uniref:hypothetical protein n=1 Tax=uncultured Psychrosphaera sp. TaxID=1403522 RepID=UPI00262DE907|nr:hypothetical protein [uncultured Psychrosphaera sp.]